MITERSVPQLILVLGSQPAGSGVAIGSPDNAGGPRGPKTSI